MAIADFNTSNLVEIAAKQLQPNSLVLDVGPGEGRNSYYLAELGHHVVMLDVVPDYLVDAKHRARHMGGLATQHTLPVLGDISNPMFQDEAFDAVVANHVLQFVDKAAVKGLQDMTKPGGIHVVEAYIGTPSQQAAKSEYSVFGQSELADVYQAAGWEVHEYDGAIKPFNSFEDTFSGQVVSTIQSKTQIIATKPGVAKVAVVQPKKQGPNNGYSAEYWRRADPEMYDHLRAPGEL